ncbi:MAG: hypothetical protein ABH847_02505 [Candidatus Omnitrophota bacterium]
MRGKASATIVVRSGSERMADPKTTIVGLRAPSPLRPTIWNIDIKLGREPKGL